MIKLKTIYKLLKRIEKYKIIDLYELTKILWTDTAVKNYAIFLVNNNLIHVPKYFTYSRLYSITNKGKLYLKLLEKK